MIREIERVTEHHRDSRRVPGRAAKRERHRVRERRVAQLVERLGAERERRLEFRYQLILRPLRLDGIRRRCVVLRSVGLHRAEGVAEEITVAGDVLRDVAERELRGRRLVAELRFGNGIECLRDIAVRGEDPALERRNDWVGRRRRGRLLGGERAGNCEAGDRQTNDFHAVSKKSGGGGAESLRARSIRRNSRPRVTVV